MTPIAALLADARTAGLDRLDAQLLIGHWLQRPRAWLIAHDDAPVDDAAASKLRAQFVQRAGGVPLAYLVGKREFHGLALRVTPDVLVPRPDTETLVDWALALLAGPLAAVAAPEVLDLGTGSGAIALAIKHACTRAVVTAVDTSPAALEVARGNALHLGLDVAFEQGDWFSGLNGRRFDLVLANPPYIDALDPHLAALQAEPLQALSPGRDGLAALRAIATAAPGHLNAGAWILLEHGHTQAEAVRQLLQHHGFEAIATRADLASLPRCTGARIARPDAPRTA